MPDQPGAKLQTVILLGLCITASAALLRTLVGATPVPDAPAIVLEKNALPGYRLVTQASLPKAAGRDKAHGMVQRWQAIPDAGGASLQIALVRLQSRSHQGFSLETLTRGPAAPAHLSIDQPLLVPLGVHGEEALVGKLITQSQQGKLEATQTCLAKVASGQLIAQASQEKLVAVAERSQRARSPLAKLAQLAGADPPLRWECNLVSVAGPVQPAKGQHSSGAQQQWSALRSLIEAIHAREPQNP